MSQVWKDLEARRSYVEQTRENASRPGRAWATYKTTGTGYKIESSVFSFGGAFMTLPIFTFGVLLDPDGDDLPTDDPPRCTAGCYDFRRTSNGYYTGAYCWFTVDSYTESTDLRMIFTLAWEGIASKDFISSHDFPVNTLDV